MNNYSQVDYDKGYLFRCLCGMGFMVAIMKATGGSGFLAIVPLMLMAIARNNSASMLFYLVIAICSLVGNGNLMPKDSVYSCSQRFTMLILAMSLIAKIFGSRSKKMLSCFMGLIPYLLFMALTASAGWCPFISYLKLILFTVVYFAYYGVCCMVVGSGSNLMPKIRSVFLSMCIFFIFGSVALIPFPGISQLTGEQYVEAIKAGAQLTSLFCGMTFHSQSLGPICAALGTALFADMVIGIKRADKLYIALLLCVPVLLIKTSSRTAMGTFVVGICCVTYFMMKSRQLRSTWKSKVFSNVLLLVVGMSLYVIFSSSGKQSFANVVTKNYSDSSVRLSQVSSNDILLTRRGKWDEGIYNFHKSPIIGNGFQVSEKMIGLKPSFKVLSAPVEKSIWISAILEEGGICGFILFSLFVLSVIATLLRQHAYIGLSMFIAFLTMNMGEFTLFSMSAAGGCLWALVFIGIMMDSFRLRGDTPPPMPPPPPPNWRPY